MIWPCIACFFATLTISFLFNVPRRALLAGSLFGVVGYLVFMLMERSGAMQAGIFWGALAGTLLSEIAARKLMLTATALIIPSIVPLVPGVGLYRTMLLIAQGDLPAALSLGVETLIVFSNIALAIACASIAVRTAQQILQFLRPAKPNQRKG